MKNAPFTSDVETPVSSDRYLTLSEVEKMMSVSRATVWRWRNEQGLKVVSIGGITRIQEHDLRVFIQRHKSGGTTQVEAENDCGEGVT